MKKFVKWFTFWLIVCGGISLAICYMVIPNETKSAIDIVVGYLNTPLGIAGGTTITLGMVAYFVVSHIFKLNRDRVKEQYYSCVQELEQKKKEINDLLKDYEKELKEYDQKISDYLDYISGVESKIIEIVQIIPNKKVKEQVVLLLEEIKNGEYGNGKDSEERTND